MANRILILGASGFIGNTIYKELTSYFDVYGTYHTANKALDYNNVMFKFNVEKDINSILNEVRPNYIISGLRGEFKNQLKAHQELLNYTLATIDCKLIYASSVHVFDGKGKFPAYEKEVFTLDQHYYLKKSRKSN